MGESRQRRSRFVCFSDGGPDIVDSSIISPSFRPTDSSRTDIKQNRNELLKMITKRKSADRMRTHGYRDFSSSRKVLKNRIKQIIKHVVKNTMYKVTAIKFSD